MGKSNRFSLTSKSHSSSRFNPYDRKTLTATNVSCPKQMALPKLEGNGTQQICIELQTLFIFAIALGTQYLNLYRSTWWLSKSANRAMNFHLIDTDVSLFTLLFIGQPSLLSILRTLMSNGLTVFNQKVSSLLPSRATTRDRPFLSLSSGVGSDVSLVSETTPTTGSVPSSTASSLSSCSLSCIPYMTSLPACQSVCYNFQAPQSQLSHTATSSTSNSSNNHTNYNTHQHNGLTNSNGSNNNSHSNVTTNINNNSVSNHHTNHNTHTINNSHNHNHNNSAAMNSITNLNCNNNNSNITTELSEASSTISTASTTMMTSTTAHQSTGPASSISSNTSNRSMPIGAYAAWLCSYHLIKCAYRIWLNFGTNGLLCISYPIVVSLIINSTNVLQAAEECRKTGKVDTSFLTMFTQLFSHVRFDDDKLCHVCSNEPDEIREEVERLRTIFNERLKYILFKSILIAYYSSFVPLCFTQSYLYYDVSWTAQHVAITWFSALIMLISCSYTPHFYNVLHRSAYHFGNWQKLETRNTLVPCINWSENVVYPQGVVVKHSKGYFRSESVSNCAQPGCTSHLMYFRIFSNPKIGFATPLTMLGILVAVQMYLLLVSFEWYKLISMTLMMLINVHSIFRLVKSLVVITKIYKNEKKH
ncbi:Transmembrane protein 39A-A [Fragariocoptes setiger]|uniref:Transmembrane protein 39A-A n=1 Tax=Fragariocoptes setiger TaxID=1670756 RepID=A0ABQ7S5K1_9ACAR|nr:Transmembrane protein 39A-A [Fragariocoptes setiger]